MTVRYDVEIDGHKAQVILSAGDGPFTGTIESQDYGTGTIAGQIEGNHLDGKAQLDDHEATVVATIEGTSITGTITVEVMFFNKTVEFAGKVSL